LIVSVPFGRFNVPFPVKPVCTCVSFIRFSLTPLVRSCKTGCGDRSIPSSGDVVVVVVVVVVAVAVVADAIGVLAYVT